MTTNEGKPARRLRSRHAGSLTSYSTQGGQRWKFQIYVPKDPERPELGDTRITCGGFTSLDEAQRALDEALKKKRSHARSQTRSPTIAEYADHWIAGLRLQNSTIEGYKKILRNHITPYLGALRIDKLTDAAAMRALAERLAVKDASPRPNHVPREGSNNPPADDGRREFVRRLTGRE